MNRCWAYNTDRQRCEQEAGHAGKHSVCSQWDDSKCWTPDIAAPAPTPDQQEPAKGACVMCDHPDHRGICGTPMPDGFGCDCAEGIPA